MKTILDLDNTDRICDSLQVRSVCPAPKGTDISEGAYAKYRRLLGIPPRYRYLTIREAFLLWTLCNLKHQNPYRRLTLADVCEVAGKLLSEQPESDRWLAISAGIQGATGREILQHIQQYKKPISKHTLYRRGKQNPKVPRFSLGQRYTPEQARRFWEVA